MTTHFLVEFPEAHSFPQEVQDRIGKRMLRRAVKDSRRSNRCVLALNRVEFDSARDRNGSLSLSHRLTNRTIANVDFESADGVLFKTAEECLAHELKARFGVDITSLDALAAKIANFVSLDDWQNIQYSGPLKEGGSPIESPIAAIESAIKAKGQTVDQIAEATALHVQDVNNIVTQNPNLFKRGAGGRIFLLPQDS